MTARALIEAPIHAVASRHSPYAPRIRTGVAWDLLVHDVDLVCNVFGREPVDVEGFVGRFDSRSLAGAEDVAEVLLRFDQGELGHVSASRVSHRKVRSLRVHEVDKLIEIDLLRRDVTIYRNVADRPADLEGRGYRQETIIEIPEINSSAEPLAAQFQHFVGLIAGDVDPDVERDSILPSHRVVARLAAL
jgi:predicted dehydrogenase